MNLRHCHGTEVCILLLLLLLQCYLFTTSATNRTAITYCLSLFLFTNLLYSDYYFCYVASLDTCPGP